MNEELLNIGQVLGELSLKLPDAVVNDAAKGADDEGDASEDNEVKADAETEESEEVIESSKEEDGEGETEETEEAEESDETEESEPNAEAKLARATAKMQKRIDKLTARAKSAEESRGDLEVRLKKAEESLASASQPVLSDPEDVLAGIDTEEELDKKLSSAEVVLEEVPELLTQVDGDGNIEIDIGDGKSRTFTKAQLLQRLKNAKDIVKSASKKREFLSMRGPYLDEAKKEYPELFDDKHDARRLMLDTLKLYPGMLKMPNVELAIGDMLNGYIMRLNKNKKVADKPNVTKEAKPAKPIAPRVIQPAATSKKSPARSSSSFERLKTDGSLNAAESFFADILG